MATVSLVLPRGNQGGDVLARAPHETRMVDITPTSSRGELVMRSATGSRKRTGPHLWCHSVWRDLQNEKAILKTQV